MSLTEKHIKIISERPLNDILDPFRAKLRDSNQADDSRQEDISSLLSALVGSTAAFSLPSPDGSGNLAAKLFTIQQHVWGGTVKSAHFRSLIRCVTDHESSDIDIWEAVFNSIESLSALTPPPSSTAPTFDGTPIKTSSSRLADSETRDIVEGELFYEIKDCTFRNVGGFWDKFFDSKRWHKEQKVILKGMMAAHDGKRWTGFPTTPDEKPSLWMKQVATNQGSGWRDRW
ncbi:hypothetical protein CDD83_8169 [Cordyceps sp. RAO-2017]|nr:hypothetical protein CDD83_8169 [Cordyceps sp. RAO-2017]